MGSFIDIFNGDADGIFSLHQYRLHYPELSAKLVSGVKRDIALLSQLTDTKESALTVFDISLDVNRASLNKILADNNTVCYFDHHFAGEQIHSSALQTVIDSSPDTCTALLVNNYLQGKHALWAVCGAFGDNLLQRADNLALQQGLATQQIQQLKELGELFNYNGYGETISDLHFHPVDLYRAIRPFDNPFDFIGNSPELEILRNGYHDDFAKAAALKEEKNTPSCILFFLPGEKWANRISGIFGNLKAQEKPEAAHAIISQNSDNTYRISVRAPLTNKKNADTLCRAFPTGGGRAAAAGINSLPQDQLAEFINKFNAIFTSS